MAKIQVKYVQFEPSAFLSDADYQIMTAEQRGIYCSIIFYLYANGGKMPLNGEPTLFLGNTNRIALLSNCTKSGEEWEQVWKIIEKKFKIKDGVLTHKRVTAELRKANNYRKQKSLAGRKGMQRRYNTVSNKRYNEDITKVSKGKLSKGKLSKDKYKEHVLLAKEEHRKLLEKLGQEKFDSYIESLNNYIGSKGKKYKSHYHTILTWFNKDEKNGKDRKNISGQNWGQELLET